MTGEGWQKEGEQSKQFHSPEVAVQQSINELSTLSGGNSLSGGAPEPFIEKLQNCVQELPQWFRDPEAVEIEVEVDDKIAATDGFVDVSNRLTANTYTRTGTRITITAVCTEPRPDTDPQEWLETERELVDTLVSVLADELDQWELHSLKRVFDAVVTFDTDLRYTYINQRAEEILGRDRDELYGEYLFDVFPEITGTLAQERIETALETQTARSFEQYHVQQEKWIEARIYPSEYHAVITFSDITELRKSEHEFEQVMEATPVGIVLLNGDGEITRANTRAEELLGLSKIDIAKKSYDCPDWDIWDESGNAIPREDHPVARALTTGETVLGFTHGITLPDGSERWLSSNVTPIVDTKGVSQHVVVALEDITRLKNFEQLIETFEPIHEILNTASGREEVEQLICDLLIKKGQYQYARIIEHTPGTVPTDSDLQSRVITVSVNESPSLPGQAQHEIVPFRVAIETGEIQVSTRAETDSSFEPWREYLLDQGFHGGAVVPLSYDGRIYDLLVLYTNRSDAFGEREQTLLKTLGNRAGQVFDALAAKRALHTNNVAELTFQSTDSGSFFVSASEEFDCTIDILDTMPTSDNTFVYYTTVENAAVDEVGEMAKNAEYVVQARQIRRTADPPGGVIAIELQGASIAQELINTGAVVTTDIINNGRARVTCEIPLDRDIDSLVTRLTESFPETTLLKKREYNRSVENARKEPSAEVLASAFEKLTNQQEQVLRAAIHSGYFESPRQNTATEIANTLSLTQSTFSYHLRNAQDTLFGTMFEQL